MSKSRLLAFVIKELREVVPPTVFFAVRLQSRRPDHQPSFSLITYASLRELHGRNRNSSGCGKVGADRECNAILAPF